MVNSLATYASTQKARKGATPQSERTPGRNDEVRNSAGGYVFKVSDHDRLERFLILGTDGATYYVNSKDQTEKAVTFLKSYLKSNEVDYINTLVDVSVNGRAFKNSPAIFALAVAITFGNDKAAAKAAVNKVVRTGTHLFEFASYIDALGGWGRSKRDAISNWYLDKDANSSLAYQAIKYRQRNQWSHRDLWRKAHPVGINPAVGEFVLRGNVTEDAPDIIKGFKAAQAAVEVKDTINVLKTYKNLPWEALKTEHLTDVGVWKTLFYNGQLNGQALVRNITRLARLGAFSDMKFAADYAARLTDVEMIKKTRLHPVNFLNAIVVYTEGQSDRNGGYYARRVLDWTPESVIIDALNEAFHLSFKTVEPAGKRTMLAIDVSGSMASPAMGLDLSCAQVSAAVAMTVARTEPAHIIRGFTSGRGYGYGRSSELTDLGISAGTRLDTAMDRVQKSNFGGTDCAQPMIWALENNVEVDTFVVITDNDTWHGNVKPSQALVKYRNATGIDARLAVLGVSGSPFTIADASDKGQMDFCGFDSSAPRILSDFSAGRI